MRSAILVAGVCCAIALVFAAASAHAAATTSGPASAAPVRGATVGSWTWQHPAPSGEPLGEVACPTATNCYAAGALGVILTSSDGGATWTAASSGVTDSITGIGCLDVATCIAVDLNGNTIKTRNSGAAWTVASLSAGKALYGARCATSAAPAIRICLVAGQAGTIYRTRDDGATWTALTTGLAGNVYGISCPTYQVCAAVGAGGAIASTTNGGDLWARPASNVTDDLLSVSCPASTDCWAVGASGAITVSHDSGATWTGSHLPGTSPPRLNGIDCTDFQCVIAANDGFLFQFPAPAWLAYPASSQYWNSNDSLSDGGLNGVACVSGNPLCLAVGDYSTIVRTTNRGSAWSPVTSAAVPSNSNLLSVTCPTATACFAVSSNQPATSGGSIVKSTDGGHTWASVFTDTYSPKAISCPFATACFVGSNGAGATEILITTDGGTTWTSKTYLGLNNVYAMSCPSASVCYVVLNTSILATTDGFTNTSSINAPGHQPSGISCPSTSVCFTAGDFGTPNGFIYSTSDSGAHWALLFNEAVDNSASVVAGFNAITCLSTTICYAGGNHGLVAFTSDGAHWRTGPPLGDLTVTAINCPTTAVCFAAGRNGVFHTGDSGFVWDQQMAGTPLSPFNSIACPGTTACVAVGDGGLIGVTTNAGLGWSRVFPTASTRGVLSISCTDASNCYAVGNDVILTTHDGGATWAEHVLTSGDALISISCPAAGTCVAVGWPGAIYRTTDAGTTWTYITNGDSGADETFESVSCPTTSFCVAVGTDSHTTLSTDGGVTWTTPSPLNGSAIFFGVSCADPTFCMLVGEGGLAYELTNAPGPLVWAFSNTGTTTLMDAVTCPSTTVCYAVGRSGTAIVTRDSGNTWTPESTGVTSSLDTVACPQVNACLAGGRSGTLLVSRDGRTWSAAPSPTFNTLRGLAILGSNVVIAVGNGGTVLQTATFSNGPCSKPELKTNPSPWGSEGTDISLTARSWFCNSPEFRFWIQSPGQGWRIVQDYGVTPSFLWHSPLADGTYNLEVDVRDTSESVSYDAVTNIAYPIYGCLMGAGRTDPPGPQQPGTAITVIGSAQCPGTPTFRFWVRPPNGGWQMVQDYSTASSYAWSTTGLPGGNYGLEVDARDLGSTDSYQTTSNFVYTLLGGTPCSYPQFTANPQSPGLPGTTVTFSGNASFCSTPYFRFWVAAPGGPWQLMQDYSRTATLMWTPTAIGGYRIEMDVRDGSSTASYDAVASGFYSVGCAWTGFTPDHQSPQPPGTTIVLTAISSCPGTATYRFWVRNTVGVWQIKQDYSTTATFSWNTTGLPAGQYGLEVDVRDQGSTASYEAVGNNPFTLAPIPCGTPTLSANPPSLGAIGVPTTFTATTSGCTNPRYRFWIEGPGIPWTIKQDYSPTNTFSYTSGGPAGAYNIEVDVRDVSESVSYDAVANLGYGIRGCGTTVTLTPNPTSPQKAGTTVTLTATAYCPGTAQYRFWVRDLSGRWTIAQDYSASATFSWNTTVLAAGAYGIEVDVRDVGSTDTYESVANLTYTIQ